MSNNKDLSFAIFKLIRHLRKFGEGSKPDSLSALQMHTLFILRKYTEPTMGEIAKQFGVTMPTATTLIERLMISGLISRVKDQNDRRIVRIKLTSKGNQILSTIMEKKIARFNKLISLLPQADIIHLRRIVNQLLVKMEVNKNV